MPLEHVREDLLRNRFVSQQWVRDRKLGITALNGDEEGDRFEWYEQLTPRTNRPTN